MEPYSSINTDKPSPVLIWKFFSFLPRFSLSHNNVLFTDLLPSIPSCFQSWFKLRRLFIFEHHSWSSTFFYSGVWLRSQRIPPPPLPPTSHSSFSVGPSCHFYVLMSYLFHLNFSTQQLRVTVCERLARFTGADWSWSLRFGSERWAKTNEEIFNQRGTAAVPSLSCAKIYTVLTVLI